MGVFDAARAANYDQGANAAIIGHDALYQVCLAVLAGHLPRRRLLVLGAGTGKETVDVKTRFPETEVIAVDPSEPMLELARAGLQADVRCGLLEDFADLRELDAIVMIGVLHHLSSAEEQQTMLREVGARLRPGGLLITGCQVGPMTDPLRRSAWEQRWRDCGVSEDEIRQRQDRVGEIVALDTEQYAGWLRESGFPRYERIFASLFFEVWACSKKGP